MNEHLIIVSSILVGHLLLLINNHILISCTQKLYLTQYKYSVITEVYCSIDMHISMKPWYSMHVIIIDNVYLKPWYSMHVIIIDNVYYM